MDKCPWNVSVAPSIAVAPEPALEVSSFGPGNVRKIDDPPFVINTPFLHEKTPACDRGLLTLGRLRTLRS